MNRNILLNILLLATTAAFLYIGSWYALHGSLLYNVDTSRDLLLLEEIATIKPIQLIGPHAGVAGLFHGPAWLYLNLPGFLMSNGNPVGVAYYWIFLFLIATACIYFTTKKVTENTTLSLLASTFFAATFFRGIGATLNPFGAVILAPIILYLVVEYFYKPQVKYICGIFLLLGLTIQFQAAYGIPISILVSLLLVQRAIKKGRPSDLFGMLALLITTSPFILFELKHNFLQIRSALTFLSPASTASKFLVPWQDKLNGRFYTAFIEGTELLHRGWWSWFVPFLITLSYGSVELVKAKHDKIRTAGSFILYLFVGFWILSLAYPGRVWSYYYEPLMALSLMLFIFIYKHIPQKLFILLAGGFIIIQLTNGWWITKQTDTYLTQDEGSWIFFKSVATDIYKDAPAEFGYYIFSKELFGYQARYAMNYVGKSSAKKAIPFEKRKVIYLLITKSDDPVNLPSEWRKYKIKITRAPDKVTQYPNGYIVEKYILSKQEQAVQSDPDLIHDLRFR